MSDEHAAAPAADHATTDHAPDGHGGHDGHDGTNLGPVDWPMWGAGLLGVALGLAAAACFALTTGIFA